MPVYYFDTDDGTTRFRDEVGIELADEQAARDEGSRGLAEMAREFIPGGEPQKNLTMWVRNADGSALLQLALTFTVQPLK